MAERQPIGPRLSPIVALPAPSWQRRRFLRLMWPGFGLSLLLAILAGLCLYRLFDSGIGQVQPDLTPIWPVLKSGSWQAFLSSLFALILGALAALALQHLMQASRLVRRFCLPFLLHASLLAMVLPTTVAAVALLSIFGRQGALLSWGKLLGLSDISLSYGLWLVVLAHVFFNAPLVMRVCFSALSAIPAHHHLLASEMGLSWIKRVRFIYWPVLAPLLPGLAGLVFLLCFTSFALVLMLGGGPGVTTLELAIFTALRFEFDLVYAAQLALVQWVFCLIIVGVLARHAPPIFTPLGYGNQLTTLHHHLAEFIFSSAVITLYSGLILLPLIGLLARFDLAGMALFSWPIFWQAAGFSLTIALLAGLLSVMMAFLLSAAVFSASQIQAHFAKRFIQLAAHIYLCLPALLLGSAAYLWLFALVDIQDAAFYVVVLANALFGLPFALRLIGGRLNQLLTLQMRNADMMGLSLWQRLRYLILPAMWAELGASFILVGALSFGDFGLIALFGSSEMQTLPYLLNSLLNRYGGPEADMLALVMSGVILLALLGLQLCLTLIHRAKSGALDA